MSTHKHFDKICCLVLAFTLLLAIFFINAERFGIKRASSVPGYEGRLFDDSLVHTIDIVMDDWDEFIENCKNEEYYPCAVVIDNEAYKNVALRAKGNTSLTQVESYGNDRYSFKIEFDHYDSSKSYYGLDKLCLNNIIQDNTYMKDYLAYKMMAGMGVASPLCSYTNITVNGEDWGLYLAVEGVEEAFLSRNYGRDYGELYKPDSMSMGGGRGNGENFDMNGFFDTDRTQSVDNAHAVDPSNAEISPDNAMPDPPQTPPDMEVQMPQEMEAGPPSMEGGMPGRPVQDGGMINGSDDVLLKYIDDNIENYPNIFDSAKTDVSDEDKTRLIQALQKLSAGEDLSGTVDIEAVIRYFVVHNFVLNFDSYTGSMIHNYYLYEKDGQLQMIPWDYNLAFGGFEMSGGAAGLVNYPIDSPVSGGNVEDRPMLAWIFENEEYTQLYHQYFAKFLSEWFENGSFEEMTDGVFSMIAPYVEQDVTRFCTYEEFEKGVSTLKEFCLLRAESIGGQLNGTIGSTKDEQDSDTLIAAGNLQISDMGSMDNTTGEGQGRPGRGNEPGGSMFAEENVPMGRDEVAEGDRPTQGNVPAGEDAFAGGDSPTGGNAPMERTEENTPAAGNIIAEGNPPQMPDMNGGSGAMGRGDPPVQAAGQAADPTVTRVWLAVSACILLLGIVFAFAARRRR